LFKSIGLSLKNLGHSQKNLPHGETSWLRAWESGLWLPVGKVTFACYSSSLRSLICLAWEKYKLAQVLNSNLNTE